MSWVVIDRPSVLEMAQCLILEAIESVSSRNLKYWDRVSAGAPRVPACVLARSRQNPLPTRSHSSRHRSCGAILETLSGSRKNIRSTKLSARNSFAGLFWQLLFWLLLTGIRSEER